MKEKPLYQDYDWLYNQCVILKKSPKQIELEQNMTPRTIFYWFKKFNITPCSLGESIHLSKGNHISLSLKAKETLDGLMLGDGNYYATSQWSACYQHGSKYKRYLEDLSKVLDNFGIKQCGQILRGKIDKRERFRGFESYHYKTLTYSELLPLYQKWYRLPILEDFKQWEKPHKFVKIVPRDIELTPLVCRLWYEGDGCLCHPRKEKEWKRKDSITLSTEGFTIENVNFLVQKLNELEFKSSRQKNNTIYIWVDSTPAFLDYIGPCPKEIEDIYGYKWNLNKYNK